MEKALYEGLMSDLGKRKINMISSIVARAKDLHSEGNELEYIYENLIAQGANPDIVLAAIKVVGNDQLYGLKPPEVFRDVAHIVESTLYAHKPKDVISTLVAKTSIGQIMPMDHALAFNLEKNINYARIRSSELIIKEIMATLKPYIENMIVHSNMFSQTKKLIKLSNDLEKKHIDRYMEWFGIWAPETIRAYLNRHNLKLSSEIDIIEDEAGREQTFCPMYKTEINVNNVCASCPFYGELEDDDYGNISKRCSFKK